MSLLELLAILGFFLTHGAKILTHGAKILTFLYRPARVLYAWFRLQGVRISVLLKRRLRKKHTPDHAHKPCQGWDCGHWEVLKTKDGSIALQHRDLEAWQHIREIDFYMERYQQLGIPIPANVYQ